MTDSGPQYTVAGVFHHMYVANGERFHFSETLAELLGISGHAVLQAPSALEALAAHPVDVLVTDVGLPKISGIELAREALGWQPTLAVIVATGDPAGPAKAGLKPAAVLVKPFSPGELALERVVANALSDERHC